MYNIEKAVKIFLEKISGKKINIDTEKNVTILEVLNKYGLENGIFTEDQKTIEEALFLLGAEEEEVETGEGLNKSLGKVSVSIEKTDEDALPANAELKLSKVENLSEQDLFGINISFLDGEEHEVALLTEMIFTISYSGESSSHDNLILNYTDQAGSTQVINSNKIIEITNTSVTFASDLPGTYIVSYLNSGV